MIQMLCISLMTLTTLTTLKVWIQSRPSRILNPISPSLMTCSIHELTNGRPCRMHTELPIRSALADVVHLQSDLTLTASAFLSISFRSPVSAICISCCIHCDTHRDEAEVSHTLAGRRHLAGQLWCKVEVESEIKSTVNNESPSTFYSVSHALQHILYQF